MGTYIEGTKTWLPTPKKTNNKEDESLFCVKHTGRVCVYTHTFRGKRRRHAVALSLSRDPPTRWVGWILMDLFSLNFQTRVRDQGNNTDEEETLIDGNLVTTRRIRKNGSKLQLLSGRERRSDFYTHSYCAMCTQHSALAFSSSSSESTLLLLDHGHYIIFLGQCCRCQCPCVCVCVWERQEEKAHHNSRAWLRRPFLKARLVVPTYSSASRGLALSIFSGRRPAPAMLFQKF